MLDWLTQHMISQSLIPHGYCLAWSPPLLWLNVVGNAVIGVAYFSIPLALYTVTRKRRDLRFNRIMLMFAAFIFACGSTHFLDIVSIWQPIYWPDAWARAFTAAISLITAIALWRLIPTILAIPSPRQLAEANLKLSEEIAARREKEAELKASEEQLRELSGTLEAKVAERTTELAETNARLQSEISDRQRMQNELQIVNRKLEEALRQQAVRSNEMEQLNKMGDLMQSCVSVQELSQVLSNFAAGYLEAGSGAVYLIEADGGMAAIEHGWGEMPEVERVFSPMQCWALRRGQLHPADALQHNLRCQHVSDDRDHVCVPLIGNGETLGLLHLRNTRGLHDPAFLDGVAKRAALALVSLKAREALFNEATHDPLTTLYNRRYLEAALEEAARRSRRSHRPVGLMMLDLDHFKAINDNYGHEVGDEVLREVAAKLKSSLRSGDIACRYGGEEFTVLLGGASLPATRLRAEQFRQTVEQLRVSHRGKMLRLTVSIGIAAFPENGTQISEVLHQADRALYEAKHGGRNRVAGPESLSDEAVVEGSET
ncbi:GGDEF domain-containing protein [Chitinimonas koreensis]|uniref:GGDEF domain-containing protein n=1 Tax=Chitinimonas koreensis TaxID=356302 RepID=UPI00040C8513|nr:sensor domain-containing diguanylate cyclase [Chitinimonas koreensis]QNM97447.1 diguanylate cyclase [Chitinimonas koreensis]